MRSKLLTASAAIVLTLAVGEGTAFAGGALDPQTAIFVESIANRDLPEIADSAKANDGAGLARACHTLVRDAGFVLDADRPTGYPRAAWTHLIKSMHLFTTAGKVCQQAVAKQSRSLVQRFTSALAQGGDEFKKANLANQ